MSQDIINSILCKHKGKWFDKHSLIKLTNISQASVSKNMRQMIKYKGSYGLDVKYGKRFKAFIRFK